MILFLILYRTHQYTQTWINKYLKDEIYLKCYTPIFYKFSKVFFISSVSPNKLYLLPL